MRGWFITGTDTGVGKTFFAAALLRALARAGHRAVGMKPVASGCRETPSGLRCDDAERLLAHGSVQADYADVNPYAFAAPVAPQLAAAATGVEIRLEKIAEHFARLRRLAPLVVVEGGGGWVAAPRGKGAAGGCGGRRRLARAARRKALHGGYRRDPAAARDPGRRHAPRLPQSRAAHGGGDKPRGRAARGLGGEPH